MLCLCSTIVRIRPIEPFTTYCNVVLYEPTSGKAHEGWENVYENKAKQPSVEVANKR